MRHTTSWISAALLAGVVLGTPAHGEPSFTCQGYLSKVEVVICTTDSPALLDQQLIAAYKRRYDGLAGSTRTAFTKEQKEWVRQRNECGLDKVCLREAYATRIRRIETEIREAPVGADARPAFADITRFDLPRIADIPLDARAARRSPADAVNVAHRFCALKGFRTMVEYRPGNAAQTIALADDTRFRNDPDTKTAYRYFECGNPR